MNLSFRSRILGSTSRGVFIAIVSVTAVAACGVSVNTGSGNKDAGMPEADTTTSCIDTSGKSVSCPVKTSQLMCAKGDSDSCEVPTLVQLTVGGSMSPCLHLVFTSGCATVTYATTCIEHTLLGGPHWQCWTSTTLVGNSVDVSECDATGKWFHFASTSSGELTVLNSECPSPS